MSLIDINKIKTEKMKTKTANTIFRTLLILSLILIVNTSFLSDNRANNFMSFETEAEESLVIEDWMTNENTFNVSIDEKDDELKIEDWMLDEKNFN